MDDAERLALVAADVLSRHGVSREAARKDLEPYFRFAVSQAFREAVALCRERAANYQRQVDDPNTPESAWDSDIASKAEACRECADALEKLAGDAGA